MKTKAIRLALCAAALGAATAAMADDYNYYPNGYNPTGTAAATAESSAVSLVTGTLSTPATAQGLEARFRTWLASIGTELNSTKWSGLLIILR